MIQIGDNIIEYVDELKMCFSLEKVLPLVNDIVAMDTMFIFANGGMYRTALRKVLGSNLEYSLVDDGEGAVSICIDEECSLPVVHNKGLVASVRKLDERATLSLILCEMVQKAFVPSDRAGKDMPEVVEADEIIRFGMVDSDSNGNLGLYGMSVSSGEGKAYVIVEAPQPLQYELKDNNRMTLLMSDGKVVNKIPQCSIGPAHICFLRYLPDSAVEVCCVSLKSKEERHIRISDKVTQVCADNENGFIALIDGRIVSYSSEVQPEHIEDLVCRIPEGEGIIMIQLLNRQVFALTDHRKVYSNFDISVDASNVVWMERESENIRYLYGGNKVSAQNVDEQTSGAITVIYDNGSYRFL